MKTLSVYIYRTRQGLGSLRTFAKAADISPSHLSRIENGFSAPSDEKMIGIARALGVSLGTLRKYDDRDRDPGPFVKGRPGGAPPVRGRGTK
jgi:transcriptional regulator with XRE-family HTH domain